MHFRSIRGEKNVLTWKHNKLSMKNEIVILQLKEHNNIAIQILAFCENYVMFNFALWV